MSNDTPAAKALADLSAAAFATEADATKATAKAVTDHIDAKEYEAAAKIHYAAAVAATKYVPDAVAVRVPPAFAAHTAAAEALDEAAK